MQSTGRPGGSLGSLGVRHGWAKPRHLCGCRGPPWAPRAPAAQPGARLIRLSTTADSMEKVRSQFLSLRQLTVLPHSPLFTKCLHLGDVSFSLPVFVCSEPPSSPDMTWVETGVGMAST